MKDNDRLVASGFVVLLLLLWLGFLVHRSPRFAGSFAGGVLAVSGAALMLVPAAYSVVKRIKPLRRWITRSVSMRTLLAWHIYAGLVGPILVLIHTGHKFDSNLGIALTAMTIIVVISGFVGRYLMAQFTETIHEKKEILARLEITYRGTAGELAAHPEPLAALRPLAGFWGRLVAGLVLGRAYSARPEAVLATRAVHLADAIADVEYAIKTHEVFRRAFARWLKFHILISAILYVLMGLHIWSAVYFGLRWFR